MSKRYYLSSIVGTGTINDPYRAQLNDLCQQQTAAGNKSNCAQFIGTDPSTGKPIKPWALCIVGSLNHMPFTHVTGIDPMPDYPLDGKVAAIQRAKLLAMLAAITARGVDPTQFLTNPDGSIKADGFRDAVRGLGQQLDTAFSEDNFDVSDV